MEESSAVFIVGGWIGQAVYVLLLPVLMLAVCHFFTSFRRDPQPVLIACAVCIVALSLLILTGSGDWSATGFTLAADLGLLWWYAGVLARSRRKIPTPHEP